MVPFTIMQLLSRIKSFRCVVEKEDLNVIKEWLGGAFAAEKLKNIGLK